MRRFHCGPSRWHIFSRGTRRLQLFRDDQDYQCFLQVLIFALRVSGCELWAYALMSNHYHLILLGDSDQLRTCMHHLNRIYARYHNKKYRLNGHVFDGPYQSVRIPTDALTLWTAAYVFLNPVKAGLSDEPDDYRWSGYRSFMGMPGSPLPLTSTWMGSLDLPPGRAWDQFHRCIRRQMDQPTAPIPGRPSMVEVHRSQFEWLMQHAAEVAGDLGEEDQSLLAMHWARLCGIAPRVMTLALPGRGPRDISRLLFAFRKRLSREFRLSGLAAVP